MSAGQTAPCGNSNSMKQNICTTSFYYLIWQLDLPFVFARLYTHSCSVSVAVSVVCICVSTR